MTCFTIAICDDELESIEVVRSILQQHPQSDKFMVMTFQSGEALYEYIQMYEYAFDLIILDIRLKLWDGVKTGELLSKIESGKYTDILFISSDTSYAMQLFDLRPLNFLVKPIDPQKLLSNVDVALQHSKNKVQCFTYKFEKVFHKIPYHEIIYFESMRKRICINCVDSTKNCYFYGSMEELLLSIDSKDFLQIHCSFLVNWAHVKKVYSGQILLDDGTLLNISRQFRKTVQEYSISFLGGK